MGNKTFDFSSKKKDFLPKNDQIWPKIGIFGQFRPGHAGLFGALLVGRLVVVARGLHLARHPFTLFGYQKLMLSPVKFRIFCPKKTKLGIFGHFRPGLAGSFDALLVGWLAVLTRGLYLDSRRTPIYFIL